MLQLNNISFGYDLDKVIQLKNLSVSEGEILAVIGESGSGKSTLLKLIYGQYDLDEGTISWKDNKILGPAYNLVIGYDFMKYVAQEFELMPFITVQENIGQYLSNFYPEEKQQRIEELLSVVELSAFANTKVQFLSGGQKQRVALAKALAKQPEILLLDEPFSHIDNFKKQSLRRNLFKHLKENKITCVMATHDKEDVLGYVDNVLALHKGEQLTYKPVNELYNNPKHPLVASFFGEYSVINNTLVYAHQLKIVKDSKLIALVKESYFKGHYFLIEADLNGTTIFLEHGTELKKGQSIYIDFNK